MIGNFIGDFVKGKSLKTYPSAIQAGIRLHREIDSFTDSHALIRDCRKNLWDRYRHYSGVIIDLYNDHFLASGWDNYHDDPLHTFADHVYDVMEKSMDQLPEGAQHMLPYMIKGNWLVSYSTIAGIDRALTGLSRRTSFISHMENAAEDLELHYDFFRESFLKFFPELMEFVASLNPHFRLPDLQ
jgi:acyl carrier protein phosphodiesterase